MNHSKISRWHLERTAFVYLRQSSPHQVKKNVESAERQRRMKQHVEQWGWPERQIEMLGGDTGKSGSTLHGRDDYQVMLNAVMAEEAGIICARELSRLVRDNQDWNQLVRLCRYQGVLLADEHRIYDPADPQDRVLLGIQGAFNEYELSLICDRMQRSRAQKAQRGELYEAFPPGYVCRQPPVFEKHPDARVQRAVEKVFADYVHAPSVLRLYRQLLKEEFELPVVPHGEDWREVKWTTPSYQQLVEMLRNPAYAGIYARGKRKTITRLDEDGHAKKKRQRLPHDQWEVFLEDHHEPYITKESWQRNLEKIAANVRMGNAMNPSSPHNGNGLMVGLLRCRRCGHKLYANYRASGVSYVCRGGGKQRDASGQGCFSFRATYLEERLTELILEVVSPAGVAAATRAAERLAALHDQERQLIMDRLNATREVEARAAREYKKTDATYTTVRRRLAQEWEEGILAVQKIEEQLARFDQQRQPVPTSEQQQELDLLGKNLHRVWNHSKANMILKKQIVRTLIDEIVVDLEKPQNEVVLMIHWAGGHHTELRAATNWRRRQHKTDDLTTIVQTLRKVMSDSSIASVLNREQLLGENDSTWTAKRVKQFREQHRIAGYSVEAKEREGWMTQSEAATYLKISPMSMSRLVQSGILPAEQPRAGLPTVITCKNLALKRVQRAVNQLKDSKNRPLSLNPNQQNLFETRDSRES